MGVSAQPGGLSALTDMARELFGDDVRPARNYGSRQGVIVNDDGPLGGHLLVIDDDTNQWFLAYAPDPFRPHILGHWGNPITSKIALRVAVTLTNERVNAQTQSSSRLRRR